MKNTKTQTTKTKRQSDFDKLFEVDYTKTQTTETKIQSDFDNSFFDIPNTKTQTTETKEVLGDLIERKLQNRIKYNFFKTLHSFEFSINTTPIKDRIKEDFKKQKINMSESEIDERVWSVLHNYRNDICEYLF